MTVTFDSDGGSAVEDQIIATGSKVTKPEDPIKGESALKYWYQVTEDESAANTAFDFNSTITSDITLKAVWGSASWNDLQSRIDNASDGETIILSEEVTAQPTDSVLVVPAGKNIILDLAGHTIDRHMTAAARHGNVIEVNGSLTVTDSGENGAITGGWNSISGGGVYVERGGALTLESGSITGNRAGQKTSPFNGGGVYVYFDAVFTMNGGSISNNISDGGGSGVYLHIDSTFTMNGGEIKGNKTTDSAGGGVFVNSRATFNMTGGEISGNEAAIGGGGVANSGTFTLSGGTIRENTSVGGGGVFQFDKGSTFNLSGDPVIADNTANFGSDVCLNPETATINITGTLTNATPIAVVKCDVNGLIPGVITSGLKGNGTAANFVSGSSDYALGINEDGEAYLYSVVTVTFDSDGGSAVEDQIIATGSKVTRPEDPTKKNCEFEGWYQIMDATEGTLAEEPFDFENTEVSESITLKAVWKEIYVFGEPDFTLPGAIKAIEENAFEGAAMSIVYIPDGCASIGAEAFKDCGKLTQVRVPANCEISESAFDGCEKVQIYGTAGSPAEAYCSEHANCVFVEE